MALRASSVSQAEITDGDDCVANDDNVRDTSHKSAPASTIVGLTVTLDALWESVMKKTIVAALLAAVLSACGSSAPTVPTSTATPTPAPAPIAPANIVMATGAGLSLPGCDVNRQMSAILGLRATTCYQFSGTLRNSGSGCATGVRGTTTIYDGAHAFLSSAGWSYSGMVRPNEQISYSGGSIDVPTNGDFYFTTTAAWDNTRCQ